MVKRERGPPSLFAVSPSSLALSSRLARRSPARVADAHSFMISRLPFPLLANEKGVGTGRTRPYPPPCTKYATLCGGEAIELT